MLIRDTSKLNSNNARLLAAIADTKFWKSVKESANRLFHPNEAHERMREMEARNALVRVFKDILSLDAVGFLRCRSYTKKFTADTVIALGAIHLTPTVVSNFSQEMANPGDFQTHLEKSLDKNDFKSRADLFFGVLINICAKSSSELCRISQHVDPSHYNEKPFLKEYLVSDVKDVGCRAGEHPR